MSRPTFGQAFTDSLINGVDQFTGVEGFFIRIVATFVIAPELILNRNRGARATPLSLVFYAIPLYLFLAVLSAALEPGIGEKFLALCLLIIVAVMVRNEYAWDYLRSGKLPKRPTFYLGDSALIPLVHMLPRGFHFALDHWTTQRYVHPAMCILAGIGVYISGDSNGIAIYLCVSGILMWYKNTRIYEELVNRVLNIYDAQMIPHVRPRLLEKHDSGNTIADIGIPITPALHDVLMQIEDTNLQLSVTPDSQEVSYD